MEKDINQAVREVCLWLPESEEYSSHGSPNFRVRKKTYATYVVNHHGDGRIALWLNAPQGAQNLYIKEEPRHFFVPPYVGPAGWLGVHLDKGISWKRVAQLVREAYEKVAPPTLTKSIGKTIEIKPPTTTMTAEEFDPLQSRHAQQILKELRKICLELPEASEGRQFGNPVWRAGRKVFATAFAYDGPVKLAFWVGVDRQGLLTADKRYAIPAYLGHNGWIALDVSRQAHWGEIRELTLGSYRHFALKRMLSVLDEQPLIKKSVTAKRTKIAKRKGRSKG